MLRWFAIFLVVHSCFGADTPGVIGYINWKGGVNGAPATTAAFSNSVFGTTGTFSISTPANVSFTNYAHVNLGGTITIGGVTYDGSESLVGLSLLANGLGDDGVVAKFFPTNWGDQFNNINTGVTKASLTYYMRTDLVPESSTNAPIGRQHDCAFLKTQRVNFVPGSDFVNGFYNNVNDRSPCGGLIWNSIEAIGFAPTAALCCATNNNWIVCAMYFEKGGTNKIQYLASLSPGWALLGSTNWLQSDGLNYPSSAEWHFHQSTDVGTHIYYGPAILGDGSVYPLLPDQPAASGPNLTFTGRASLSGGIRSGP